MSVKEQLSACLKRIARYKEVCSTQQKRIRNLKRTMMRNAVMTPEKPAGSSAASRVIAEEAIALKREREELKSQLESVAGEREVLERRVRQLTSSKELIALELERVSLAHSGIILSFGNADERKRRRELLRSLSAGGSGAMDALPVPAAFGKAATPGAGETPLSRISQHDRSVMTPSSIASPPPSLRLVATPPDSAKGIDGKAANASSARAAPPSAGLLSRRESVMLSRMEGGGPAGGNDTTLEPSNLPPSANSLASPTAGSLSMTRAPRGHQQQQLVQRLEAAEKARSEIERAAAAKQAEIESKLRAVEAARSELAAKLEEQKQESASRAELQLALKGAEERKQAAERRAQDAEAKLKKASASSPAAALSDNSLAKKPDPAPFPRIASAYSRMLSLLRAWEAYDKQGRESRAAATKERRAKEKAKEDADIAKRTAENKRRQGSLIGRLLGRKPVTVAHTKQVNRSWDEATKSWKFEGDDDADKVEDDSSGGLPHPPYLAARFPPWSTIAQAGDAPDETAAASSSNPARSKVDGNGTGGSGAATLPSGPPRGPRRGPRSRYALPPGMNRGKRNGAAPPGPRKLAAPPTAANGFNLRARGKGAAAPRILRPAPSNLAQAAVSGSEAPAQAKPKTAPSMPAQPAKPAEQSGAEETPRQAAPVPIRAAPPLRGAPIGRPGQRPGGLRGRSRGAAQLRSMVPQRRPLGRAPQSRAAVPVSDPASAVAVPQAASREVAARQFEAVLGMRVYFGQGVKPALVSRPVAAAPASRAPVDAEKLPVVVGLRQSIKRLEQRVAQLRAEASARPDGGVPQVGAQATPQVQARLRAALERLRCAEAKLKNRDRVAAVRAAVPLARPGVRIETSGEDGSLVTLTLRVSRFSLFAVSTMFAGVFTAGTVGGL